MVRFGKLRKSEDFKARHRKRGLILPQGLGSDSIRTIDDALELFTQKLLLSSPVLLLFLYIHSFKLLVVANFSDGVASVLHRKSFEAVKVQHLIFILLFVRTGSYRLLLPLQ
jgi:hypothetical protein